MAGRRNLILFIGACLLVLPQSGKLHSQVPDPGIAAAAPVPGSGHHYIGIGAETVNPADGSLTFDLPIELPSGRGISMTFGIRYSGNEDYFPTNSCWGAPCNTANMIGWQALWIGGYSDIQEGPWSYTVPMMASRASTVIQAMSQQPQGTACPGGIVTGDNGSGPVYCPYSCVGAGSAVFRGLDGKQVSLPIGEIYPANTNWSGLGNVCASYTSGSSPTPGNLHGILSWITPNGGTSASVTVVDQSGTTYQFPNFGGEQPPPGEYNASAAPPASITDRNGNQITYSQPTINGQSAMAFTDSTGRQVLALAAGPSGGTQILVSGLGGTTTAPITPTWTTTTVTFPENYTVASGSSSCTLLNGQTGVTPLPGYSVPTYSQPVISSIALPNGQSYSFTYDGTYGKVSKITFPDGGYVRYVWGLNRLSQSSGATWIIYPQSDYSPEQIDCTILFDTPAITDRYVSFDGTNEVLHQQFTYSTVWPTGSYIWTSKSTVVTTAVSPTGQVDKTTYTYGSAPPEFVSIPYGGGLLTQIPIETNVLYQDGSGNTYKQEYKNWAGANLLSADETVLYSNGSPSVGSAKGYCYDANDQVTNVYEYGTLTNQGATSFTDACGSTTVNSIEQMGQMNASYLGSILRETDTVYQPYFSTSSGTGIQQFTAHGTHIVDAPETVTVPNPAGGSNPIKQTTYLYDQSGTLTTVTAENLVTLTAPPSPPWPSSPPVPARGNITTMKRLISGTSTVATTKYTYLSTGEVASIKDPCGNATCSDVSGSSHTTTYSYTDAYASGTGTPPSTPTYAYLTTITNPLNQTDAFTWGYDDGQIRSHTDKNNQTSNYFYNDPGDLARLTEITYPDGGKTWVGYSDTAPNPSMTVCKMMDGNTSGTSSCPVSGAGSGTWDVATSVRDGLGHTVQTQHTSDPEGTVYGDTIYDGLGQVYQQGNPTRCSSSYGSLPSSCSESTWGYTQLAYDPLGRKTLLTHKPDSSAESWSYSGPTVTFTDENTHKWARTSDSLGRPIQVNEPNNANTYYNYDLLDDLACAAQDGANGGTPSSTCADPASWRPRSFTYDDLSRLLTSYNPETGTTTYTYDYNSNVSLKTDARSVTVSYTYDDINRILKKIYSDSATPVSCYLYGTSNTCYQTSRLINEWTSHTGSSCPTTAPTSGFFTMRSYSCYDTMGRLTSATERHCIGATCSEPSPYSLSMTYDVAGNLDSLINSVGANGSPLTLTNYFDTASRPCLTTSSWTLPNTSSQATGPANLFQTSSSTTTNNSGYAATGALQNWYLGSTSSTASTGCSTNPSSSLPGNLLQQFSPRLWVTGYSATGQVP